MNPSSSKKNASLTNRVKNCSQQQPLQAINIQNINQQVYQEQQISHDRKASLPLNMLNSISNHSPLALQHKNEYAQSKKENQQPIDKKSHLNQPANNLYQNPFFSANQLQKQEINSNRNNQINQQQQSPSWQSNNDQNQYLKERAKSSNKIKENYKPSNNNSKLAIYNRDGFKVPQDNNFIQNEQKYELKNTSDQLLQSKNSIMYNKSNDHQYKQQNNPQFLNGSIKQRRSYANIDAVEINDQVADQLRPSQSLSKGIINQGIFQQQNQTISPSQKINYQSSINLNQNTTMFQTIQNQNENQQKFQKVFSKYVQDPIQNVNQNQSPHSLNIHSNSRPSSSLNMTSKKSPHNINLIENNIPTFKAAENQENQINICSQYSKSKTINKPNEQQQNVQPGIYFQNDKQNCISSRNIYNNNSTGNLINEMNPINQQQPLYLQQQRLIEKLERKYSKINNQYPSNEQRQLAAQRQSSVTKQDKSFHQEQQNLPQPNQNVKQNCGKNGQDIYTAKTIKQLENQLKSTFNQPVPQKLYQQQNQSQQIQQNQILTRKQSGPLQIMPQNIYQKESIQMPKSSSMHFIGNFNQNNNSNQGLINQNNLQLNNNQENQNTQRKVLNNNFINYDAPPYQKLVQQVAEQLDSNNKKQESGVQLNQIGSSATQQKNMFNFHYVIGKGGFGKVWKVEFKQNKKFYAMKEMSKAKQLYHSHYKAKCKLCDE